MAFSLTHNTSRRGGAILLHRFVVHFLLRPAYPIPHGAFSPVGLIAAADNERDAFRIEVFLGQKKKGTTPSLFAQAHITQGDTLESNHAPRK